MNRPTGPIPPPILATGVPHPLHQYADSLNPTFDHIALMTENLHRLDSVEAVMQDTMRNDDYVNAMALKIRNAFQEFVRRLREEITAQDTRLRESSLAHEERMQKQSEDALCRIQTDLNGIAQHSRRNLENMLVTTKDHNFILSRNVRAGQTAWSRLQTQLIMLNASL